jgi:hypothetical protein
MRWMRETKQITTLMGSDDSVLGAKTRCQTYRMSAHSLEAPFKIELRLYRTKPPCQTVGHDPTRSYGTLMLADKTMSCEDCFSLIYNKTKANCSFPVFQLPEDMSIKDQVCINRESKEFEAVFRRILGVSQRAGRFPCGSLHRSVGL